jgi:hypothetical protein
VDLRKSVAWVIDYGMGGFGNVMEFENAFWNMFETELPKYKDCLDIIFLHHLLEIMSCPYARPHA